MFLLTHAAAGATIAKVFPDPLVYVPLSFAGHFVLDAIPHWHLKDESKKLNIQIGFDSFLTLAFLAFIHFDSNLVMGAFVGMLMDLDAVLFHFENYRKNKFKVFPKFLSRFHAKVQNETKSLLWGIVSQAFVIVVTLSI